METPIYPNKPIFSMRALALALGEPEALLLKVSNAANYMYRSVPQKKKNGSRRETYDAHEPLKRIQKKIIGRILSRVIFPSYLHGGIKDLASPRSIYSNVKAHLGAQKVVLLDIEDFFPSITVSHVYRIFNEFLKFENEVSAVLAKLTTLKGCVPQGACTSSYLANLVFWDVECLVVDRLTARGLKYSRFADDITISARGEFPDSDVSLVISDVVNMLAAKGCRQKRSKLHVRRRGQAVMRAAGGFEPLTVTGLSVFNFEKPSVSQKERNKIRSSIKKIELLVHAGEPWALLEPLYNRAMGRVGRLIACKHLDGTRLKARLETVKRIYDVESPESFITGLGNATALDDVLLPPWEVT
ncbi:reverse transcriptase [Pseudomonas solani]|uniref:Reverse transcriptase n=1 Tax=Pseudomonas solani TaxID=2731552 RepID=A0ABM7L5A7_9PSED|nr:reverse transcriptase family protein [Pseudomonas solani]BCD84755.1 reverse transcriptase [Pseudomonas solani]